MRVLEDVLKPILKSRGVAVPVGGYAPPSAAELNPDFSADELVIKALTHGNDRQQRGEIQVVSRDDFDGAVAKMADIGVSLWVEDFVPHSNEFFLGVVWPGESDTPTALFSSSGGSGVVDRASAGGMRRESIPLGARAGEVAARLVEGHPELVGVAEVLIELFDEVEALSLELNPVVIDAHGRPVVLDAKGYLDPYGRHNAGLRAQLRETDSRTRAAVPAEYVALDGWVGVLSIGAGLTRAVIDWLSFAGPGAACFTDLISAVLTDAAHLLALENGPTVTATVKWLSDELEARGIGTLLVCLVSGGTPTDALTRSVIAGLTDWRGSVVSFVAGNRSGSAREIWLSEHFTCPATLAEAIDAAVVAQSQGRPT